MLYVLQCLVNFVVCSCYLYDGYYLCLFFVKQYCDLSGSVNPNKYQLVQYHSAAGVYIVYSVCVCACVTPHNEHNVVEHERRSRKQAEMSRQSGP